MAAPRNPTVLSPEDRAAARRLAMGFAACIAATTCLIVLGALVRSHEAGLACPDWPLCFGEVIPEFDVKVAFEWSHRALAGAVSLLFAALAFATLRRPALRARMVRPITLCALLLATQVMLGALTVWELLASWTVTSHLVTGNAFNAGLLWCALRLGECAAPTERAPTSRGLRALIAACGLWLLFQLVIGGLVSSTFAGMACPEWPTCNGGVWFPAWSMRHSVGLHVHHRVTAYMLVALLCWAAVAARGIPRLGPIALAGAALGLIQMVLGIANVLLGIPVEVTGAHSAGAALLVLCETAALREVFAAPRIRANPL